jgi:hypothetical protein
MSRWSRALDEHREVVGDAVAVIEAIPSTLWSQPLGPSRWTFAAMALHIGQAYEFSRNAALRGDEMRLRVPAAAAWIARHTLLPLSLATRRFPQGARAPREVRPDESLALTLTPQACAAHVAARAAEAVGALHAADPSLRVQHAYFGPIPALTALRVLSAHTRHHVSGLRAAEAALRAG